MQLWTATGRIWSLLLELGARLKKLAHEPQAQQQLIAANLLLTDRSYYARWNQEKLPREPTPEEPLSHERALGITRDS